MLLDTAVTQEHVNAFLKAWHEAGREQFERYYPTLDYDGEAYRKTATWGRRWIKLDTGTSGAFMADRHTGQVFRVKAYGVPHLQKFVGLIWNIAGDFACQCRSW